MKISTKGRYALRLMADIAQQRPGEPVSLRDAARRQGLSDKYLEQISHQGTRLIPKDADGYYQGRVEAVRSVPYDYRCYKLGGLVQLEDPPVPGETHWIFFRSGMYEDLHVGDTVRFSVSYSQLRSFPDLKNARNLYPGELQRLN